MQLTKAARFFGCPRGLMIVQEKLLPLETYIEGDVDGGHRLVESASARRHIADKSPGDCSQLFWLPLVQGRVVGPEVEPSGPPPCSGANHPGREGVNRKETPRMPCQAGR
jgi:hypothetical protein